MCQVAEARGPGGALWPAAQTGAERTAGGGAVTRVGAEAFDCT